MACLCGDTHCPFCGPAQGNWKCPICGNWADDGCEHIDEDSERVKDEFIAQANAIAKQEHEEAERIYAEYEEEIQRSKGEGFEE